MTDLVRSLYEEVDKCGLEKVLERGGNPIAEGVEPQSFVPLASSSSRDGCVDATSEVSEPPRDEEFSESRMCFFTASCD